MKTIEELKQNYKDYYILLETNLLGKRFDIIKCLSTRPLWTTIVKADGNQHSFAASIEYGLKEKWFVPFFHIEYAKKLLEEYTNRIVKNVKTFHVGYGGYMINKESITSQLPKYLKEKGI